MTATDELGAVVRCERSYYRVIPGGHVWLTDRDDQTSEHHGYDSKCSYCWLNQTHSEAAHAAGIASMTSTPKRFDLLGGPGGYLTCLPVGDSRRHDRYRRWETLMTVNRPLTTARADCAKGWAVRVFDC